MLNVEKKQLTMNYTIGKVIEPKYIVIHETDNSSEGADADAHFNYWNTNVNASSSVHFVVDGGSVTRKKEPKIIQLLVLNQRAWHVGDNINYSDITNSNSIGIEICVNSDGNYDIARANAIELVKKLLKDTGISTDNVVRHKDASGKNCPNNMIAYPYLWEDFKNKIKVIEPLIIDNIQVYPVPQCLLAAEQEYIDENPDVSIAVYNGWYGLKSGLHHYIIQGKGEGRIYDLSPLNVKYEILANRNFNNDDYNRVMVWCSAKNTDQEYLNYMSRLYYMALDIGINPLVSIAQVSHETGFFYKIPSQAGLDKSYHNPCGLKITAGGGDYQSSAHMKFASWYHGFSAYLDHLALYLGVEGYPLQSGFTLDPRHFAYLKGTVKYVEDLSGKWCPNASYHATIIKFIKEMEEM